MVKRPRYLKKSLSTCFELCSVVSNFSCLFRKTELYLAEALPMVSKISLTRCCKMWKFRPVKEWQFSGNKSWPILRMLWGPGKVSLRLKLKFILLFYSCFFLCKSLYIFQITIFVAQQTHQTENSALHRNIDILISIFQGE